MWYITTHAPAKIPCTAPTAHQLQDILWAELRKWHSKMPAYIKQSIQFTSNKLSISEDVFAVARTARKENPDAFQGFHADNLLFIGDEASGIEDVIFEVAQGALSTKGAKIILTGNPTRTSGYFFRCFGSGSANWWTKTVSCFDSSRVDSSYIDSCKAEYGESSNFWRVRVLGEFPTSGDMQFISTEDVERCMNAVDDNTWSWFPIQIGVDVARHGDDSSVIVVRQGQKVHEVIILKIDDLITLSDKVQEVLIQYPTTAQLAIDVVGMGYGVHDTLKRRGYEDILEPVTAGSTPRNPKYFNKRAEMWDAMRQAIKEGLFLPKIEQLKVDLTGIQYDYNNAKQQLMLEKKADLKKRGLKSPDTADALALTYAYPLSADYGDEAVRKIEVVNGFSFSDYV